MWYQEREEGLLIFVKVVVGSKQNRIVGIYNDDFLKIKISSPPEKGKANQALVELLAKKFDLPKNAVQITKGQTQPLKLVFLAITSEQLLLVVK